MLEELQQRALRLDQEDELAPFRDRFDLPSSTIYLCGNSLGARLAGTGQRIAAAIDEEWAEGLVRSWNRAGWIDLSQQAAARLAPMIGAQPGNVAVTDSTSVNLFKLLAAAIRLNPGKQRIVSERDNFPTDLYIAEGICQFLGQGLELVLVDRPEEIAPAIDGNTAVVMLSHVNYRTGLMLDMKGLTRHAHAQGALTLWDLAHSAGAVELDLAGADADFAVGCGYKYLNGGPGAPAFLHVADRHLNAATQPLSGWFSHRSPFAFEPAYAPAEGIARFQTGTPPILSLIALHEALGIWQKISMAAIRRKSLAMTDLFIEAVDRFGPESGLALVTPRDPEMRGSQVCLSVAEHGHAIMNALIADGVIGDFRAPDILRFGFAPLYNRHLDAVEAAKALHGILASRGWDRPEHHARARVT